MTTVTERPPQVPHAPVDAPVQWAWTSGPCRALEHDFEVWVEAGWDAGPLAPVVAPFRLRRPEATRPTVRYEIRSSPERPGFGRLYADGERVAGGRYTSELLAGLTWHINQSVIRTSTDRYMLMHAAAATTANVTVVLAADMESGKTTTVAGLLRSGFDYVTDEAVAVDPETGQISPFPKTLSVDPGSWPLFPECAPRARVEREVARVRQWMVEPHRLGARVAAGPVSSPEVVLFPKYVAGATTQLVPVSAGEATHELCRMNFEFARHPGRNLRTAARLASTATCARLRIGDLDDAVDLVHELVSQRILESL